MFAMPMLFLLAVMDTCPCEYIVDCGSVRVAYGYGMEIVVRARDGSARSLPIDIGKHADPEGVKDLILDSLQLCEWEARPGPGATLFITGNKKGSAVRSVSVKSRAPVPTVRWVPIGPPVGKEPKK
jgi:hypothetical protein